MNVTEQPRCGWYTNAAWRRMASLPSCGNTPNLEQDDASTVTVQGLIDGGR